MLGEIQAAAENGDKERKNMWKAKLPFFTVGVKIKKGTRRRYVNIEEFTGYAQLDFDGFLSNEEALEFKQYLFEEYKQMYCVFLSPSGLGVKAIIKIPIVKTVDEYKTYYKALETEFNFMPEFDPAPKNAVLPLYISEDENILSRANPETWTKHEELVDQTKFENLTAKAPTYQPKIGDETVYKSEAYYRKISMDIFQGKIDGIINQNGHGTLRSSSLVLGSRAGAGYLSIHEAMQHAEYCVKGNAYLNKGLLNYLKTTRWGISQGFNKPKYYE